MCSIGTEQPVVAMKPGNTDGAKGLHDQKVKGGQPAMGGTAVHSKPFKIPKNLVFEAFKRVKANGGVAGVDAQSIEEFENNLSSNLYRIWNRMSSGCYFPPAVRRVDIEKTDGKTRTLGIPTVSDRVAQMVAKLSLEPSVEPYFHPDSYGYRPKRSAHQAVAQARARCWQYDWVLDLDIKGFFDNLDHDLVMKAVRTHTREQWILLYVERWLKAPMQDDDGQQTARTKGTPQGGVVSPLLANLFLHYAFDHWMQRNHQHVPFERYADDIIVHLRSKEEAEAMKKAIEARMQEVKLSLHPEKTKIVYCRDDRRRKSHVHEKFDFLGFTFRPRAVKVKSGFIFIGFNPGISDRAKKEIRKEIRDWRIAKMTTKNLWDIATYINPTVRGWVAYYGKFFRSELVPLFLQIQASLNRWVRRKYKRFDGHKTQAARWLQKLAERNRQLFYHWNFFRA